MTVNKGVPEGRLSIKGEEMTASSKKMTAGVRRREKRDFSRREVPFAARL